MFSLDPQIVALALGNARLASWEWNAGTNELRWTSGQSEIYSRPAHEINTADAWNALVHPEDIERLNRAVAHSLETHAPLREQFRVAGKDGKFLWIFADAKVVTDSEGSQHMLGLNIDVTDWVEVLTASEARFVATFEQAAVGIAHIGLDGKWLNVNRRCCEIVGYSRSELLGLTFGDITHPDDLATDLSLVQALVRGEHLTYSLEKRYIAKDGRQVWVNLTVSLVRRSDGEPDYFISVIEDINERKQIEAERDELIGALEERVRERTAELEKLSLTDALTGVANRRRLDEHFAAEWDRAVRTGQPVSVAIIDIDHFKEMNDTLGHATADQALIALAGELNQIARRPADLTARYGGDEFVMVLAETGVEGALATANRIHAAVHRLDLPNPGSPMSARMTVSQGVATASPTEKGAGNGLMLAADRALYEAKQAGRDRIGASALDKARTVSRG